MIVLITDKSLYILSMNNYQVINYLPLAQLKNIVTITTNSSIFALNFETKALLLESIRRTEVLIFLLNNADNDGRDPPKVLKSFKVKLSTNKRDRVVTFKKDQLQVAGFGG